MGSAKVGIVYLFDGTDGTLLQTINNPEPNACDYFGVSVTTTNTGELLIGAHLDDTGATDTGSVYLFEGISTSTPAPIILSVLADDPDDLDNVYSVDDTIVVEFDSDTNTPGGNTIQTRTAVDDLFRFSEPLGQAYRGQWITPDTFAITIKSVNNAGPPLIGSTTVTPAGITSILSFDATSVASSDESPELSGDFGEIIPAPLCGVEKIQILDILTYDEDTTHILDLPQLEGYTIMDVDFLYVAQSSVSKTYTVLVFYTPICE